MFRDVRSNQSIFHETHITKAMKCLKVSVGSPSDPEASTPWDLDVDPAATPGLSLPRRWEVAPGAFPDRLSAGLVVWWLGKSMILAMENSNFLWENPLFLWWFSSSLC